MTLTGIGVLAIVMCLLVSIAPVEGEVAQPAASCESLTGLVLPNDGCTVEASLAPEHQECLIT